MRSGLALAVDEPLRESDLANGRFSAPGWFIAGLGGTVATAAIVAVVLRLLYLRNTRDDARAAPRSKRRP